VGYQGPVSHIPDPCEGLGVTEFNIHTFHDDPERPIEPYGRGFIPASMAVSS